MAKDRVSTQRLITQDSLAENGKFLTDAREGSDLQLGSADRYKSPGTWVAYG